jgi:hypothetical protein
MTPLRLMILQFSQSFLTDARTFICLNPDTADKNVGVTLFSFLK